MRFREAPFAHQNKLFAKSALDEEYAFFMEQGTGKTKSLIDTIAAQALDGKIDAAVIVTPKGIMRQWSQDELPKHMSPDVPYRAMHGKLTGRRHREDLAESMLADKRHLPIFIVNYEQFLSKKALVPIRDILDTRRVLMASDESTRIGSPSASRTRRMIMMSPLAKTRRIMTGTPTGRRGPFGLYSQLKFLGRQIHGFDTYAEFKSNFGIFSKGYDRRSRQEYPVLEGYKNIHQLHDILDEYSFRVTKDECFDLPPKTFQKVYVELCDEQRRFYDDVKANVITDPDLSVPNALVRMLRLQQIACGYKPVAEDSLELDLDWQMERLGVIRDLVDDSDGKVVVWSRFSAPIDTLMIEFGGEAVRYDGTMKQRDRDRSEQRFKEDPTIRIFVGNPAAAGIGLNLQVASTCIYHSNSFSYEDRVQSEDRVHRYGMTNKVTYYDVIAEDTVDEYVQECIEEKKDVAELINRDGMRKALCARST